MKEQGRSLADHFVMRDTRFEPAQLRQRQGAHLGGQENTKSIAEITQLGNKSYSTGPHKSLGAHTLFGSPVRTSTSFSLLWGPSSL